MSSFGNTYGISETTEIYLKRVLPGTIESVRLRLSAAMEQIGYDVIEEEPTLRGRRAEKGWAQWYGSADVMDYATTLVIRFKAVGPQTTRVTFDYTVAHQWLMQGEKEILVREAEAIVALASARSADKVCLACGTETIDDSRYCRRCGSPLTTDQTALEVLRIAAEGRAAHSSVVTSVMLSALTSILFFFIAVLSWAGRVNVWKVALAAGLFSLFNVIIGRFAWTRLKNALKLKTERPTVTPMVNEMLPGEPAALPPPSFGTSVTEGTTELFGQPKREPVSVVSDKRDTDSIN